VVATDLLARLEKSGETASQHEWHALPWGGLHFGSART